MVGKVTNDGNTKGGETSDTQSAKTLKNSERVNTGPLENQPKTIMDTSKVIQSMTSQTVSLLNNLKEPSEENIARTSDIRDLLISSDEFDSLNENLESLTTEHLNQDEIAPLPKKLSVNRLPVNVEPEPEPEVDITEALKNVKKTIEGYPLKEQLTALDKYIDNSEGIDKIAGETLKGEMIKGHFPNDLPLTNRDGEMKAFIKDFKAVVENKNILGINKGSRTDSIVKALENYEKVLNKYPDNPKAQLEALEKLQSKIKAFEKDCGDSTKLGWVKALDQKIGTAPENLLTLSVRQNGLGEMVGRMDSYKNFKPLNDTIVDLLYKDNYSPAAGGSFSVNTWNLIKDNPEAFFGMVSNLTPEQKENVMNKVFSNNVPDQVDLTVKENVNKYMDFLIEGSKNTNLQDKNGYGDFNNRLCEGMCSNNADMRAFIMNKAFTGGIANSSLVRDYISLAGKVMGTVDVNSVNTSTEILENNPALKEFSAFKEAIDKTIERNPGMSREDAEKEVIRGAAQDPEQSLMWSVAIWNSVLEQGKTDPEFLKFAQMSDKVFYEGAKAGLDTVKPSFTDQTNKLDTEVFKKIQDIQSLPSKDDRLTETENLLSELGLGKDTVNSKSEVFMRNFILGETGVINTDSRSELMKDLKTENPMARLNKVGNVNTLEKAVEIEGNLYSLVSKHKTDEGKLDLEAMKNDAKELLRKGGIDSPLNQALLSLPEKESLNVITNYLKGKDLNMSPEDIKKAAGELHTAMLESVITPAKVNYMNQVNNDKKLVEKTKDREVNTSVNPLTTELGKKIEIEGHLHNLVSKHKTDEGKLDVEAMKHDAGELVKKGGISSDLTWALLTLPEKESLKTIALYLKKSELNMSTEEIKKAALEIHKAMLDSVPTIKDNKLEIDGKEYKMGKQLGQGAFGTAYSLGNEYVAKIQNEVPFLKEDVEKLRNEAIQELDAHKNAGNHPNVLKLVGVARSENGTLVPITQKAGGGSIDKVIKKIDKADISNEQKIMVKQYILRKIMEGMDHVQVDQNMMHFDLKEGNILFDDKTLEPLIGDFGISKTGNTYDGNSVGTPGYLSPEMMNMSMGGKQVTNRSDTWSLGVIMHQMMLGDHPFKVAEGPYMGFALMFKTSEFASDDSNRIMKVKAVDFEETQKAREKFNNDNPKKTLDDFGGNEEQLKAYEDKRIDGLAKVTVYKDTEVTPQNSMSLMINQMMHPDPAQRPTLEAVKQMSFFSDPLGSDEQAKEILKNILA
jgi:serine/threonine protein kinase